MSSVQAGWYDDPSDHDRYRYWDGTGWTDHFVTKEPPKPIKTDPPPPPASLKSSPLPPRPSTLAPERTAAWPASQNAWCRACGLNGTITGNTCSQCGWPSSSLADTTSRVGLVYELGRLRKRLAVCVADAGVQLHLHLDEKDDRMVDQAELPPATEHTPVTAPPAVRLHLFEELRRKNTIRTKTNPDKVLALAEQLTNTDVASMRAVFDVALARGWGQVLHDLPLPPTEKAWRSAHHYATIDDCQKLVESMAGLPPRGYDNRVGLLAPHLTKLVASHRANLLPMLDRWDKAIRGVAAFEARLKLDNIDDATLRSCTDSFVAVLPAELRQEWSVVFDQLHRGIVGDPIRQRCRIWAAHRAFATLEQGQELGDEHLANLPLPFLEQVLAQGAISSQAASVQLRGEQRAYALSRLQPDALTNDELIAVRHSAELARRAFVDRNETMLMTLPATDDAAGHYLALHRFREGADYNRAALRPEAREKLEMFDEARTAVRNGAADTLPDRLLDDPTLWPALQQLALDGKLTVGLDQRAIFPEFAEWVDLHALVAMLWKGEYREADQLGERLACALTVEQLRDEALSLRAFALHQLGMHAQALSALEDAMEGDYTEALLINTCLVASSAEPTLAARYLARLVNEAPNDNLRVAAVRHAISIWPGDEKLPAETAASLRRVLDLETLSDADYIDFIRLRSMVDSVDLAEHPPQRPPTMTKAIAYDVYVARALALEGKSTPGSMARTLISSSRNLPDEAWLRAELDRWIDSHFHALTSLDYGDAPASATEFDTFLMEGEEYLSRPVYLAGAPLAGVNISVVIAESGNTLNDQAASKFFYLPSERFLQERSKLPEGLAETIGYNFYATISAFIVHQFVAVMGRIEASDQVYNQVNHRRQWDYENRFALTQQMRSILDEQAVWVEPIDRAFYHLDKYQPDPSRSPDLIKNIEDIRRDLNGIRDEIMRLRARI